MKIVLFYHSLLSDWNHGNAHFLRGIVTELLMRGNNVLVYEQKNSWSLQNLKKDHGQKAIDDFHRYYPLLQTHFYDPLHPDFDELLFDADLVLVHEWNDHSIVEAIGEAKQKYSFRLLFHDTHHRAVTDAESMESYSLGNYDGVLAFGKVVKEIYLKKGWAEKVWVWHEAADTRIFKPQERNDFSGDLVWIGNWGDNERTKEIYEYIIEPVKQLHLKAMVYGVRYPEHAVKALKDAGIEYAGWLPNFRVPEVFSKYRFTVHVPRGPYVKSLPGVPTIRPFEALACGIPLISAPWNDVENLFSPGKDFLTAASQDEMILRMKELLHNPELGEELTAHGLKTINQKHTCSIRVDELYGICEEIGVNNLSSKITA